MAKYFVTHRFHLIPAFQSKTCLPECVERTNLVEAETIEELSLRCGQYLATVVKRGGLVVDNPLVAGKDTPILPNVTAGLTNFDLGVFVPGHMVAWVETITTIKPRQNDNDEETEVPLQ